MPGLSTLHKDLGCDQPGRESVTPKACLCEMATHRHSMEIDTPLEQVGPAVLFRLNPLCA